MDVQAEKLKRFITLEKEQEKDWWDQLSAEEKSEIEEGLAQVMTA